MMPDNVAARARARELSRFHDTRLEPVLRSYFGQVAPDGRDPGFIADNARLLQSRLDQLAVMARPAPLLTGADLAIADCGFVASFAILDLLKECLDLPVTMPDSLADYADALAAHPSVAGEDARYRAALRDWAAGQRVRFDR
jgi:glutathione S-transferase